MNNTELVRQLLEFGEPIDVMLRIGDEHFPFEGRVELFVENDSIGLDRMCLTIPADDAVKRYILRHGVKNTKKFETDADRYKYHNDLKRKGVHRCFVCDWEGQDPDWELKDAEIACNCPQCGREIDTTDHWRAKAKDRIEHFQPRKHPLAR